MGKMLSPLCRQLLAATSCGLLTAGLMTSWGYPAAALPQMKQENSTIHFTPDQASWFATVTLLMSIPGSFIGSVVSEMMGPRRLFLSLAPPFCFSFMLMGTTSWSIMQQAVTSETFLLIVRVIQASLVAMMTPVVSIYTFEVSGQSTRGMLTCAVDVWCTLGVLLCYIAGCFMTWETIAWVLPLITTIPGYLGILWSPESPHWLARNGKEEESRQILNQYRSSEEEASQELKTLQSKQHDSNFKESLRTLIKKPNLLATIASSGILSFKEFIGFSVVSIYIVHIFETAGAGFDPKLSSVVVGVVRLVCNGFATALLYKFPRKCLLVGGNVLAAASTAAVGLFFYLQSRGDDISSLGWLPLVALTAHMIAASSFVSPTAWIAAVEVLPGEVRSVGFGIGAMCFSTTAFVTSKSFVYLKTFLGLHGIFWMFTAGSIIYIIFTISYIPETFGRSMQDIEDYWNNSRKKKEKEVFV